MPHSGLLIRGRYRLNERIAAGAVGQVWRATDQVLQRPVAVKMLRAGYSDHAETLMRFRGEARLAGSLTHPGIAQVHDYGEDGAPFLVMELVDGPSLATVLESGPLDPVRTADIIAQAAAGLDAAHSAGLVHRDIKPENLLIGPGNQIKITDFGIAYATGSAPLTSGGIVMGTTAYLAPERAIGAPGSPASDLYSLGLVGYECLTGTVPFDGTRDEIVAGHLYRELPALPAEAPARLAELIRLMTDKDPARRPANAAMVAEYAAQLRDAMAGGRQSQPAAAALAPARRHPTSKVQPRSRRRVMAGATAAVASAGLGSWLVLGMLAGPPGGTSVIYAAPPGSSPAPGPGANSNALKTVKVNAHALEGRPLNAVLTRLRALGLLPLLQWEGSTLPTGTVIQVVPGGAVTPGSTIMVLAAYQSTAMEAAAPGASGHPRGGTGGSKPAASPHGSAPPASSPGAGPTGSSGSPSNGTAAQAPAPSPSGNLLQLPLGIGLILP